VRRFAPLRVLLLIAVLSLAPPAVAAVPTYDPMSWTSWGYDNQLGNAIQTKTLTQEAASRLELSWSLQLDGPVFAQPLAATLKRQLLIFAATEAGTVYAVSAATGQIVWQRRLGTVETLECGSWGITSTGAIDLERHLLFEISADGLLHALDLATGEEAAGYPLTLITNNLYEYVWGGLRIANGHLYVANASYCDVGPRDAFPEERLFSVPLAAPEAVATWDPVPGAGNLGGIWGWGGVSIDPETGRLFTGVGNSSVWSDECSCYVDNAGYGNKLVELLPDLSAVVDSNDPGIAATGDSDFGAAPLLFHPSACPRLAAANNKNGTLYIWNRERLSAGPLVSIPLGDGISAFVGSPGWSDSQQMIYAAQSVIRDDSNQKVGNGITAWHADQGCGFRPIWSRPLGDGNQATPLVVGNTVFATGGRPGGFYALRADTGDLLWSYATKGRTVAAMISVAGEVFGADAAGVLYAFEPIPTPRGSGSPSRFPN
jgi:outer membrane protein assembly factor BamB